MSRTFDFVIVGSGIIGLSIARALVARGFKSICLLEKEAELAKHTSGRNSGVLHAGIYYAQDSLKAKFCIEGSRALQAYAVEKKINCMKTGKVIVAANEREHEQLLKLYERALKNSAKVSLIDQQQLKEIEPEAVTYNQAIHSPETAVIDSKGVLESLRRDLSDQGVQIRMSAEVTDIEADAFNARLTSGEKIGFGHLINAAGLQADRVARCLGAGENYKILPFKGLYRELKSPAAERFRGSIYPTPDPRFPFLGVHITRTTANKVILGPTAIPALGRENYGFFEGMDLEATPGILLGLSKMLIQNTDGIRTLVREEFPKYSLKGFAESIKRLAPCVSEKDITSYVKVGLRAQLVRKSDGHLEMDFKVEQAERSTHILNAISPGFTCSLPFGEFVCERIVFQAKTETSTQSKAVPTNHIAH